MSYYDLNAPYLAERRRLRRRLTYWRALAALFAILAIALLAWRAGGFSASREHIARVAISGVITGSDATVRVLGDIERSNAKAVLLTIESPGGTTAGAERLYGAIRKLNSRKPVVAVVRGMAASGGYIAAIAADRVYAQQTSLIGSIGVLVQIPNVGKLLDHVGVEVEEVKSSPLKAAPNGLGPTSPEARAALQAIIADSYAWFRDLVKERRGMSDAELQIVADGRVFTGRQAAPLKLIDGIGDERQAIEWLEAERGVAKGLRVLDWAPRTSRGLGGFSFAANVASWLGFEGIARGLAQAQSASERSSLDGLVAIWQSGVIE